MRKIVIIGGGAGGLAAAVAAGHIARKSNRAVSVDVYEALDKTGRSILASGNGRCNFSNMDLDIGRYHNPGFVAQALSHLDVTSKCLPSDNPVADFLANHGLMYREEPDGRLYPATNKSSTVLDVLLSALSCYGIDVQTASPVRRVAFPKKPSKPFHIEFFNRKNIYADKVIVACGGRISRDMLPDGLGFTDTCPMLCPLKTDTSLTRHLNNIRVKCAVRLERRGKVVAVEQGEVLFRKYGVSGIAVFNLSRYALQGDMLVIDFFPDIDMDSFGKLMACRKGILDETCHHNMTFSDFARGLLLDKVAEAVMIRCGIEPDQTCDPAGIKVFADKLKNFNIEVKGICEQQLAQVNRGGFKVGQFDPATLEYMNMPGLHVVGEALDVDGPCGGYNLHWAFASGILAGQAAVLD